MKHFILFLTLVGMAIAGKAQLIITGAVDGPLTGGTPKAIELYALEDIPDLSIYGLGAANNGGGTDGIEVTFPATQVKQGDFIYVASEKDNFTVFFGFPPHFTGAAAFINGDDALELFKNGVVIDIFGDINVDGSGQPWEYLDGWAYRVDNTGPDGSVFALANWTFSGPNALDGETLNDSSATPFPIGSYSQITIDGTADASGIYGDAKCVQDNETGFGDNSNPDPATANGSELDAAHAYISGDKLYLMLTGNLESNFNKLEIFIDAAPGGQNTLAGNNPDVDFNGLNRMGMDANSPGLTFDDAFTSDYYYTITAGNNPVEVYASTGPTDGSGGTGTALGGGVGTFHALSNGGSVGLNNSNIAGVTNTSVVSPELVGTGVELSIPLSEIGNPTGALRIVAFINSGGHDFVSNQVLCGLGGGVTNLGDPRNIDFSSLTGDQYFSLCAGIDGGMVFSEDGQSTVYTCPGDNVMDVVSFDSVTTSTASYTYVITDNNGTILGLPPGDSNDFDGAGIGECWVWGLSYTGNITAMVGQNATAIALTDSCFDLSSNYIRVIRDSAEAGVVTTAAGEDTIAVCLGAGSSEVDFTVSGNSTAQFAYVITDPNTEILGINTTGTVDFGPAGPGECWVWGLSFTGNVLVSVGDTVANAGNLTDGCFNLSDDYVVVFRDSVEGGTISNVSGEDTVFYCISGIGGGTGMISFDSAGTIGDNFIYVITDPSTKILGVNTTGEADFTGAGIGECWIWGLSYNGNLLANVGDTAASTTLADGCYELSENYITIFRDSTVGGTVSTQMGADTVQICLGGSPEIMRFDSANTSGMNFSYVVTDPNGVILGLPPGDAVDFSGAGVGECWVWGLSYVGNITASLGDTASAVQLADGCYDLSSNYVVVLRDSIDGGTVTTEAGEDTVYYCISGTGGGSGMVSFDSAGTVGDSFIYVITDPSTKILGVSTDGNADFTGAGIGECWIWGLSYNGNLLATVGDTAASTTLADECYELSSNYVVIFRDSTEGGTVSTQMGADTVQICLGGSPEIMRFDSANTSGMNFSYVVTDPDGVILGLPPGDAVDFSGAGVGECWVWGLSYVGNITASLGDTASAVQLADGCYDLSSNYVVVLRDSINGGTVTTEAGEDTVYYCISGTGGGSGMVSFDSAGTVGDSFIYVITDPSTKILGVSTDGNADFTGAGIGECWIWGLSYNGNLLATVGDTAASTTLADECYELSSNYVVIFRDSTEGGTVSTQMGADTVQICLGSTPEIMRFDSANTSGMNFSYVVTDPNGVILGLPPGDAVDFSGAGVGECWVWGLSYVGNITASLGDTASAVQLADGCYDLSDNFVVVFRDTISGGMVLTEAGEDTVYYCVSGTGGGSSVVAFDSSGHIGANFAYVITDPSTKILGVNTTGVQDFAPAGIGECWVWGLSYNGSLTAMVGDTAANTILADSCYELSENYVVVFRDSVNGGDVAKEGTGQDTAFVCLNDTLSNVVYFDSTNTSGPNFVYVITDTATVILGVTTSDFNDFSGAGVGECWVWGLAYSGSITAQLGDTAASTVLTDGCYDLSDTYLTVLRDTTGDACNATGIIDDFGITSFNVYPVPTEDLLQVSFGSTIANDPLTYIEVYNVSGQMMMRKNFPTFPSGNNEFEIDVNRFKSGVYVLLLRNGDRTVNRRFVRQ